MTRIALVALAVALVVPLGGCELFVHFDPVEESGGQCADRLDNDGDGLTDCADPGCAAACGAMADGGGADAGCGLGAPQLIPVANGPLAVVAAHVHTAGVTDVLVATSKELVELRNTSGTLAAQTPLDVAGGTGTVVGLVAGSFDNTTGDDAIVLLTSSTGVNAALPLFDSSGTYTKGQAVALRGTPRAIVAGEYNGKPPDDAVVAMAGATAYLVNGGSGVFSGMVADITTPVAMAGADADADGHADIAIATASGNVAIFRGGAAGTSFPFSPAASATVAAAPIALVFADFDGKPALDVVALLPGSVVPLVAAADGSLTAGTPISLGGTALALAAADLDGDGRVDLAVGLAGGTIALFQGDGKGGFKPAGTLTAAHPDAILALALDASHLPSVVVAEREDNRVAVYRNSCPR